MGRAVLKKGTMGKSCMSAKLSSSFAAYTSVLLFHALSSLYLLFFFLFNHLVRLN